MCRVCKPTWPDAYVSSTATQESSFKSRGRLVAEGKPIPQPTPVAVKRSTSTFQLFPCRSAGRRHARSHANLLALSSYGVARNAKLHVCVIAYITIIAVPESWVSWGDCRNTTHPLVWDPWALSSRGPKLHWVPRYYLGPGPGYGCASAHLSQVAERSDWIHVCV